MRHIASILSLFSLLVTQSLPLAHVHEHGDQPIGHGARPHIHLHEHGHDGSHHLTDHDADDDHEHDRLGDAHGLETPHDDGAVYLERLVLMPQGAGISGALNISAMYFVLRALPNSCFALPPPKAIAEPPPDGLLFGPPLYLRELSLRI